MHLLEPQPCRPIFGHKVDIRSPGSQPTKINPYAIPALGEVGADFKSLFSKTVDDLPPDFVDQLDYVITLCAEEVCAIVISKAKRHRCLLPDPAGKDGTDDEQLAHFRNTRNEIHKRLETFPKKLSHVNTDSGS